MMCVAACFSLIPLCRGATSSSFRGGKFHEISFDDVIVLTQPCYNFFANDHIIIISGESRIIFLPERSSIYQYRPEISAIIVKKQSRTRLLFAHPLLYILKTQKMYCAF